MTNAPAELLWFRGVVMATTGLTDPVEVGISGDDDHPKGYHRGVVDIVAAGNYPVNDYSTRQLRDRVSGNDASAMDIGDDWPHGGRAAWLRFNNSLIDELYHYAERLPNLRAMNFSRDGVEQKRYDTNTPSAGIINSTDSVTIHTHLEFWRDKVGRAATLDRIAAHLEAAVNNTPLEEIEVALSTQEFNYLEGIAGRVDAMYNMLDLATVGYSATHNQPNAFKAAILAADDGSIDVTTLAHDIAVELAADPSNPLTQDDVPAIATAVADKLSVRLSA